MHTHFLRSSCHTRFHGACTTHESHRDALACIRLVFPLSFQRITLDISLPMFPICSANDMVPHRPSASSVCTYLLIQTTCPQSLAFCPESQGRLLLARNYFAVANINQGIKFDKILSVFVRIGVDSPKRFLPAPTFKKKGLQIRMEFRIYRNDKGYGFPGAFSVQTGNRTEPVLCVRGN